MSSSSNDRQEEENQHHHHHRIKLEMLDESSLSWDDFFVYINDSKNQRKAVQAEQQQQQHIVAEEVAGANQIQTLLPVVPRRYISPESEEFDEEEQTDFFLEFDNLVLDVVGQCRRRFPYKHFIYWSLKVDHNREYNIYVMAKCMSEQNIALQNQIHLPPIMSRSLPGNCKDEEQQFIEEFENLVVNKVRHIRRRFYFEQMIEWSMEYDDDKTAGIDVTVSVRH